MSHVFISHASEQQEAALVLRRELAALGVHAWVASEDIPAGHRWASAIPEAVRQSGAVVVLVSRRSCDSDYVRNEVGLAVDRKKPILPAFIERVELRDDLRFYLNGLQRFEAFDGLDDGGARRLAIETRDLLAIDPADAEAISGHVVEASVAATRPPPPPPADPLAFRVTRGTPAYFALLIDCSHSMNLKVNATQHRRDVVASTVNNLLYELGDRALHDDGSYLEYFDVTVLGYGLGDGYSVESLLGDQVVPITAIAGHEKYWAETITRQWQPDNTYKEVVVDLPVWVEPTANVNGHTITGTAFRTVLPLVEEWVDAHPDSIPPMVLHITDGGWDRDDPPHAVVRALQELATTVGNVLVFNCHVFGEGPTLAFPPAEIGEELDFDDRMRDLLDMSSQLHPKMVSLGLEAGYSVGPDSRGYVYNANAAVLADFIDIGTLGKAKDIV